MFEDRDNAVQEMNEAGDADPFSMKRLNKAAEDVADADDKLARVLAARDWPVEIGPEVEGLLGALIESYPVESQLSSTEDFDQYLEFFDAYYQPIAADVPTEMYAIEVKLGIGE